MKQIATIAKLDDFDGLGLPWTVRADGDHGSSDTLTVDLMDNLRVPRLTSRIWWRQPRLILSFAYWSPLRL